MRNPTDRESAALLASKLDQLTAGLADSDPKAVLEARKTLVYLGRDASPALLWLVFDALATALEGS
jgi:hypothetical protein